MGLRSDFKRKHKRAATDAEYEALKQERDANADTRLRARIIRCCELAAKGDEVSRLEPCEGLGSRDSTRLPSDESRKSLACAPQQSDTPPRSSMVSQLHPFSTQHEQRRRALGSR